VRATRINHVSIAARDLEESTRFYESVFAMERIPTPTFESPVQWLRVGDMQLHLFLYDGSAPARHHLGITIDDFDAAYDAVKEQVSDTWGWQLVELPSRQVQLYFRDPAENLIELNWPDADLLDRARYPELRKIAEYFPQQSEHPEEAVLYLHAGE
jgi:catechol 2,3-dioxygenase-like lactoylglutathione lyase family enzyme